MDSTAANPYASFGRVAAEAPANERLAFMKRTYMHVALAVYALVALEFVYFNFLPLDSLMPRLFFAGRLGWLLVLGGFMLIGTLAHRWARSDTSVETQYAGLLAYVFAESIILCPLLWIANDTAVKLGGVEYNPIVVAAGATLALFTALSAGVLVSRKDFSFLGPALGIAGMIALGLIVLSVFVPLGLGIFFIVAMIALAAGYTLYYTSNVLHHYPTDAHVAASLALFASLALMFWYVLQLVLSFASSD